jgi:single-strand DNA-binding protein
MFNNCEEELIHLRINKVKTKLNYKTKSDTSINKKQKNNVMIKLQIIGNLGKDCIVKEVNGKNVINFSVAHSEKFRDAQGAEKERTTWVECAYWIEKTNVAQYLTKGRTVYAEGYPQADAYANKDGQPAATLRMRVTNVQLLSSNNSANEGGATQQYASSNTPENSFEKNSYAHTPSPVSEVSKSDLEVGATNEEDPLPF